MATPAQKRLIQKRLADIRKANNARFKWPKWTGFSGITLRDWIGALATPLTILIALFGFGWGVYTFNTQQANDHLKSIDEQQQTTLATYVDRMSDLLQKENLRGSKSKDVVRQVAEAQTLTALQNLNPVRKGILVKFLYESGLIVYDPANIIRPIIALSSADLSNVNLSYALQPHFLITAT